MEINDRNTNNSIIMQQQQVRSVKKQVLAKLTEQNQDSVSISKIADLLIKLKNHPDVRAEKVKLLKELIEQDQVVTREKLRIGIRKMLLEMFSQQTL